MAAITISVSRTVNDLDGSTTTIRATEEVFAGDDLEQFDQAAARSAINAMRSAIGRALEAQAAAVAAEIAEAQPLNPS